MAYGVWRMAIRQLFWNGGQGSWPVLASKHPAAPQSDIDIGTRSGYVLLCTNLWQRFPIPFQSSNFNQH